MNECRRAGPGATGCGGSLKRAAARRTAGLSVFFSGGDRVPAARCCARCWLSRLLAAPLLLFHPAPPPAEAHAGETETVAVSARTIPAAGVGDPDAGRDRSAPRPESNADDDDEEAPPPPASLFEPVSAGAAAGAAAARSPRRGVRIRAPPGAAAPPALRVLRTASIGKPRPRGEPPAFRPRNTNNARPSPDAMRPPRAGTG